MDIVSQNVNLHNFQLISVSVQSTAQMSFKIFLQTRITVDGVKFSSHNSGSHFKSQLLKIAAERKMHNISL